MAIDKVAYWLDIANYDLDTAEAMYTTGRWLYVAFMCHQVIEATQKTKKNYHENSLNKLVGKLLTKQNECSNG